MEKGYTEVPSENCDFDTSELKELTLPPKPKGIREWTTKDLRYNGEPHDMEKRMAHKVYSLWALWGTLIMNKKLAEFLDTDCESDSKSIIVDIVDQMGKLLGDTDILEEIAYLTCEDKKDFYSALARKQAANNAPVPAE